MSSTFQSINIPNGTDTISTSSTDYVNIPDFNADGITISGAGTTWLVELSVAYSQPSEGGVGIFFAVVANGNNQSLGVCQAGVRGDGEKDRHCAVARGLLSINSSDDNQYTLYPQWRVDEHKGYIEKVTNGPNALMTVTLVDDGSSDTTAELAGHGSSPG